MVETRSPEEAHRDERTLMNRLISRQGLSQDEVSSLGSAESFQRTVFEFSFM